MKKQWLIALGLALVVVFTAACSNSDSSKSDSKTSDNKKENATNEKSDMMQFYMDLVNKINANDSDINAYEAALAADPQPSAKELADLRAKAAESAPNVVTSIQEVKIPSGLKDNKSDLEAVLKDLEDSYQLKADELKKDKPSLDAANEKLTSADEALGSLLDKVGLAKASISNDVNS
ncbi:hypothetical protein [Bacillus sp. FJAT-49736]|uniref:hypothetical protein n=1 Tax=Bacillus sp. FJAT-49736 TaxID=2833582 RepID=UPI001BCA3308|nr:hypothetical protein [Bacillus sp. FJAT-49736]MBS4174981.1 hypothetical protein [Bacillus sp. FJAT-49736]